MTGKFYNQGGLLGNVISNWQASTIIQIHSGQVFSLLSGLDNNGDGVFNDRAYLVSSNVYNSGWAGTLQYLNPAAVSSTAGTLTSRNAFTGPYFKNVDFALGKTIPVTERLKINFTAQAHNLFNFVNFGLPVNTVSSPSFGQILNTDVNNLPRVIQLALRIDF